MIHEWMGPLCNCGDPAEFVAVDTVCHQDHCGSCLGACRACCDQMADDAAAEARRDAR